MKRNNHNWRKAWKYFYPEGNGQCKKGHVLHHKDPTLKYRDPVRYNEWRPEDLEMLSNSEHARIHMTGRPYSTATRERISIAKKGKTTWMKGKHHSKETREKLSAAKKGKPFSAEHCENLSAAHKGKPAWNKGRSPSPETRAKMREAALLREARKRKPGS